MRDETKARLYALLETRVLARRGNLSDRDYLAALGDGLPALRKRFYTTDVVVDYTKPQTIDSYLLAYFPHYVFTASAALERVPCAPLLAAVERGLDVVCIGGGPLPELVALVDRMIDCGSQTGTITLTTVDINAATWASAVRDSIAIANLLAPQLNIQIAAQQRDCTAPVGVEQASIPQCDLLMIQNCLNEVGQSANFWAHASEIAAAVRFGGHLVVSDLVEYTNVTDVVPEFERLLQREGYQAISRFDQQAEVVRSPFASSVPPRSYFGFFGCQRDTQTGERTFPDWRRPKAWIKFSTSVWLRSPRP